MTFESKKEISWTKYITFNQLCTFKFYYSPKMLAQQQNTNKIKYCLIILIIIFC